MGQEIGSVAVIGLGRIGLPLAAAFAGAGLRVVGVDRDPALVAALNAGEIPSSEPGLRERRASASCQEATINFRNLKPPRLSWAREVHNSYLRRSGSQKD